MRTLPTAAREGAIEALAHEEAQRPFDLARGPLCRGALLHLGDRDHVLLFTMHHIVSDGWSTGVMLPTLSPSSRTASITASVASPDSRSRWTSLARVETSSRATPPEATSPAAAPAIVASTRIGKTLHLFLLTHGNVEKKKKKMLLNLSRKTNTLLMS